MAWKIKKPLPRGKRLLFLLRASLFFGQPVVYHFRGHNRLNKGISPCFRRFYHFYSLGQSLWAGLKGCNRFLCHDLLFYLFMYGHSFQDGIVFFQLHPVRGILLVLGGDVTGSSGHSGLLVLRALHDHLYSVSFLCHGAVALAGYLLRIPFSLASFKTAEIPFLLIAFKARVDTRRVIQRSSSGM